MKRFPFREHRAMTATMVIDWSTAELPVWRELGPEIAEELRRLATMPIEELRRQ